MDYRYDFYDDRNKKKKKVIFIIVFFIIAILVVSFFFRNSSNAIIKKVSSTIISPFYYAYNGFNNVKDNFSFLEDNKKLKAENENLKKENEELDYKILETKKIIDENNSLKQMLDIKNTYQHFEVKMANIIYRDHDNWSQTFRINIGETSGIKLNQAVIHKEGLVGYISKVEENTSTVTTILDPIASVSVNISTVNEPAILQGDLSLKSDNKLKLTYIPLDTEISISDVLYTSGLGSIYPNSIPVGKIIEIVNNKNDINRYAIVEPNVNIRSINEVGIIIK